MGTVEIDARRAVSSGTDTFLLVSGREDAGGNGARTATFRPICRSACGFRCLADYSQTVDHGASFPALPLPFVHLGEQVEERLLGVRNIAVCRPAEELELAHHQLAFLKLNM